MASPTTLRAEVAASHLRSPLLLSPPLFFFVLLALGVVATSDLLISGLAYHPFPFFQAINPLY